MIKLSESRKYDRALCVHVPSLEFLITPSLNRSHEYDHVFYYLTFAAQGTFGRSLRPSLRRAIARLIVSPVRGRCGRTRVRERADDRIDRASEDSEAFQKALVDWGKEHAGSH